MKLYDSSVGYNPTLEGFRRTQKQHPTGCRAAAAARQEKNAGRSSPFLLLLPRITTTTPPGAAAAVVLLLFVFPKNHSHNNYVQYKHIVNIKLYDCIIEIQYYQKMVTPVVTPGHPCGIKY